jgi:hypothetical protein
VDAFARLVIVAVLRTVPFFTLQALVPIYFLRHFHASAALGDTALTMMLLGGAAGHWQAGEAPTASAARQSSCGR